MATAVACGGGAPPQFSGVSDREVQVGTELVVELVATDEDGDELHYSFDSDVPDIDDRASMTKTPSGAGLFRWTPLAADVGTWYFDFTVTDGSGRETVTIQVDVKSAVGQNGAPVFREPLGTGTTLDLRSDDCLEINVVVEDQDSSEVVIAQEDPSIRGAALESTSGLSARWTWCPSEQQIAENDRYMLVLSADDQVNPKTVKNYLIVLRKESKPDCPGEAPVVTHTPSDESTLVGLTIPAEVSDDVGLKRDPLLYYSYDPPGTPPDLSQMTQVSMVLVSGDMQSGQWAADVPNPVADMPAGSEADVHYVIVAADNDDTDGDCDHVTQSPPEDGAGHYTMTVTNPGGQGGAALCEPCTTDVQCGGTDDLCVRVGTQNEPFCLQSCTDSTDCPTDYTCSDTAVTSVDDATGKQCVPNSNSCDDPGGVVCTDDAFEENDTREVASENPFFEVGTYADLVSCPAESGDDEDWYQIDVSSDADVTLTLEGTDASDLDLALYDIEGSYVTSSVSLTSSESIERCLDPGVYYVRVHAYGAAENPYTLTYSKSASTCGDAVCQDDEHEDDDDHTQARQVEIYPEAHVSETNAICADDADWYEIQLYDGEKVVVDLTFEQTSSDEDLDVYLYDDTPTNLTPCCQADNGQSVTSNEHLEYAVEDTSCSYQPNLPCTFYVVVEGYNGAENLYDIQIGMQFTQ